jgi:hypothetical protein
MLSHGFHNAPKDVAMGNRDEIFGRLLRAGIGSIATYEGKTAPIVEDEL